MLSFLKNKIYMHFIPVGNIVKYCGYINRLKKINMKLSSF